MENLHANEISIVEKPLEEVHFDLFLLEHLPWSLLAKKVQQHRQLVKVPPCGETVSCDMF